MENKNLDLIRQQMKDPGIDAYIIPITDPHLGEYVPEHWRIINWLTGFYGSAANVVITQDFAGLWTDSRYFIQAEMQLQGTGFKLMKLIIPHTPEYIDWLAYNLSKGSKVAMDGRIIQIGTVKLMEKILGLKGISLDTDHDLVSGIWKDRQPMPGNKAFEHDLKFAGKSRNEKLKEVRARMKKLNVSHHFLSSLDDIAWLLNIRGSDVEYSPLITAFALIDEEKVLLCLDEKKITGELISDFERDRIQLLPYIEAENILSLLPGTTVILLNPDTISARLYKAIGPNVTIVEDVSIPTRIKAVKNNVEIENIKSVMVKDGIALTRFFIWLEHAIGRETVTEISAAEKLLNYRMEQENCKGPSFATIAAYNEHGASPHYTSTAETNVELKPEGIFLLDSGGQYLDGTTDVTRTVALGKPSGRQKTDFTLALKGTINLAKAKFPLGTRGYQIEILARKALWDNGLNYGHGTGHGVGYFLNVHEGPQTIGTGASGDLKTILEPGMLTADEPAIYREGEYGFRTENLILCVEDGETEYGKFLRFETVTLCFIDTTLIDRELLNADELDWINEYHTMVYNKLAPGLKADEQMWLKKKTKKI